MQKWSVAEAVERYRLGLNRVVRAVVHDRLCHCLILSYEATANGLSADDVINEVVKQVAVV